MRNSNRSVAAELVPVVKSEYFEPSTPRFRLTKWLLMLLVLPLQTRDAR